MSFLVALPHYLLHTILSGWLELDNIARLDTAYCNRSLRVSFLRSAFPPHLPYSTMKYFGREALNAPNLHFNKQSEGIMRWVLKRNITITDLVVTQDFQNDASFRRGLLDLLGDHVTRVCKGRWCYVENANEVIDDVCERCPNVRHFYCHELIDSAACEQIGMNWPLLSFLAIEYGSRDEQTLTFGRHCKNLTHIDLNSSYLSSEGWNELLRNIGLRLQNLLGMQLRERGAEDVLRAVARYCPNLRELEVREWNFLPNLQEEWANIAQNCPNLQNISMRVWSGTVALLAVAQHGAKLEHLYLMAKGGIEAHAVEHLALRCRNLRSLSLYDQHGLIDDHALLLLAGYCPELQKLTLMWLNPECTSDIAAYAIAEWCHKLTHLALPGSGITDSGLTRILRKNPGITVLDVHKCRGVTEKSMFVLPQLCPYMEKLNTYKCKVKIAGVHAILQGCRHLRSFDVPEHLLTKARKALDQYKHIYRPGLDVNTGEIVVPYFE